MNEKSVTARIAELMDALQDALEPQLRQIPLTVEQEIQIRGRIAQFADDLQKHEVSKGATMREQIEQAAKICHEANRAYCQTLGDETQPTWEQAPQWQRDSAIKGVEFHIANLSAGHDPSPSASHESWLAEKAAAGWTYGPEKNADKKTHPCFMLYDGLPIEQRLKDYIFAAIVKAIWTARQVEARV